MNITAPHNTNRMRYRLLAVVTGLALGLSVFAAVPAVAAPPQPTQQLGTLVLACFTFSFTGDLLDPGEGLTITPDGASSEGPGFENGSTEPIATRTLCVNDPVFLTDIADGNSAEQFVLRANPGSSTFTVSSVTMTLTYA